MGAFPLYSQASTNFSDAITLHCELTANGNTTCLSNSSPITILDVSYVEKTGGNSTSHLDCGGSEIVDNHKNEEVQFDFVYHCSSNLVANVSGHAAEGEMWLITYVSRDTRTTPDPMTESLILPIQTALDDINTKLDNQSVFEADLLDTLGKIWIFIQAVFVLYLAYKTYRFIIFLTGV